MVEYRPNHKDGTLMPILAHSESVSTVPYASMIINTRPFSPEAGPRSPVSPTSPARKRAHGRSSLDRSEVRTHFP